MSDEQEQEWEKNWWGDCWNKNAFGEIVKQNCYMPLMGLTLEKNGDLDLKGKSVLDIGGGPLSILLRAINHGRIAVADPCDYPPSVARRYKNYGIEYVRAKGEILQAHFDQKFDEVWMYNVLQHTTTPHLILHTAQQLGKTIRIFDWLNVGVCKGHPSNLTEELFHTAMANCGGSGQAGRIANKEAGCIGTYFAGVYESHAELTEPIKMTRLKSIGDLMLQQGWKIVSEGIDQTAVSGTFLISRPEGNRLVIVENGEIKNLSELG